MFNCFGFFRKKKINRNKNKIKHDIYYHHLLFYDDKQLLYTAIDNIIGESIMDARVMFPTIIFVVDNQNHSHGFTRNRLHVNTDNDIITEITGFG
jgi:hypothetical protein